MIEHGVACCEHTCDNPAFQQYTTDVLSTPGLVHPDTLIQYAEVLKTVTGKTLNERQTEMDKIVQAPPPLQDGGERRLAAPKADDWKIEDDDTGKTGTVEGLEMEETKDSKNNRNVNGAVKPWLFVAVALGCISLFTFGWIRKRF